MSANNLPWPGATDDRLATTGHKGLMSKADKAKLDAMYRTSPRCILRHSVAQGIATAVVTNLAYDTEDADTHAFHSTTVNADRITIPTGLDGLYLFGFRAHWQASAAVASRLGYLTHSNASSYDLDWINENINQQNATQAGVIRQMAAGEFMVSQVFQNSGGGLNVLGGLTYSPVFWAIRLGD